MRVESSAWMRVTNPRQRRTWVASNANWYKWPRRPPSTGNLIRHLMDQHGLTRADMVPILGTPSRVSEVLGGQEGAEHGDGAEANGLTTPVPSLLRAFAIFSTHHSAQAFIRVNSGAPASRFKLTGVDDHIFTES